MSERELLLLKMEELLDYQATLLDHQKLIAKVQTDDLMIFNRHLYKFGW